MSTDNYYVYAHRRLDTNEIFYIGKGKDKRAYSKSSRNKWWLAVTNKHGYSVELMSSGLSEQDSFEIEKNLIKWCRNLGITLVNCTDGGEGMSGYKASESTKLKLSKAMIGNTCNLGKKASAEARTKMSIARTGKVHTDETKIKQSISAKKLVRSDMHNINARLAQIGKKVECIDTGEVFDKISNAARHLVSSDDIKELRAKISALSLCLNGKNKSAYGMKWRFIDE